VVRQWLIEEVKQVLVGVNSHYYKNRQGSPDDTSDSAMNQIEHWANAPKEDEKFECECGATWHFNSKECCCLSPMSVLPPSVQRCVLCGWDDVVTDTTPHDYTPSIVISTKNDYSCIPFEPRLLNQKDNSGRRKTKEDVVNIDLVVVGAGSNISSVINEFDIAICQSFWDGRNKFIIPSPNESFLRQSELTNTRDVREMLLYAECIAMESQKTIQDIISESRTCIQQEYQRMSQVSDDEEELNCNFLESLGVINDLEEYKDFKLAVDEKNVFSELFEPETRLPLWVLWLVNTFRAILIEKALLRSAHPSASAGVTLNSTICYLARLEVIGESYWNVQRFKPNNAIQCNPQAYEAVLGEMSHLTDNLFAAHNSFAERWSRVEKYRSRGVTIKPLNASLEKCKALRELRCVGFEVELVCGARTRANEDEWMAYGKLVAQARANSSNKTSPLMNSVSSKEEENNDADSSNRHHGAIRKRRASAFDKTEEAKGVRGFRGFKPHNEEGQSQSKN
jgi:hypothetical protein